MFTTWHCLIDSWGGGGGGKHIEFHIRYLLQTFHNLLFVSGLVRRNVGFVSWIEFWFMFCRVSSVRYMQCILYVTKLWYGLLTLKVAHMIWIYDFVNGSTVLYAAKYLWYVFQEHAIYHKIQQSCCFLDTYAIPSTCTKSTKEMVA